MARAQSLGRDSTSSAALSHQDLKTLPDFLQSGTISVPTDIMSPGLSPESGSGNESGPGSDQQDDPQSPDDSVGPGSAHAGHGDDDASSSTQTQQMPVQKRRRVTRACDECRRKKIKCDGKQPCTHCSVYSYGEQTRFSWSHRRFALTVSIRQNVRMISHLTGGAIQLRSTLRRSRTSLPAQRPYFASTYQKSI